MQCRMMGKEMGKEICTNDPYLDLYIHSSLIGYASCVVKISRYFGIRWALLLPNALCLQKKIVLQMYDHSH